MNDQLQLDTNSIFWGVIYGFVQVLLVVWPLLLLLFIITLLKLLFRKEYGVQSITQRGERVRSHTEKKIADILYQYGIRYEYETPVNVGWWIFKRTIGIPDFYLPDYNAI